MHSLVSISTAHSMKSLRSKYWRGKQKRYRPDCADAQSGLYLLCLHMPEGLFSLVPSPYITECSSPWEDLSQELLSLCSFKLQYFANQQIQEQMKISIVTYRKNKWCNWPPRIIRWGPSLIANYLKSDQPMSSYYNKVYHYLTGVKYPLHTKFEDLLRLHMKLRRLDKTPDGTNLPIKSIHQSGETITITILCWHFTPTSIKILSLAKSNIIN